MTFAVNQPFEKTSLLISDMATPTPAFTAMVGIQGFSRAAGFDTKTVVTPNSDPSKPGKSEVLISSTQPKVINFNGTCDGPTKKKIEAILTAQEAGTKNSYKWFEDFLLANGGGSMTGLAVLDVKFDAAEFENYKISGTITFDSTVTWTAAAA